MSTLLPWFRTDDVPLFLAPMARFTDKPFRQLCKEQGADVMITEFVMCEALLRGTPMAWRQVDFSEEQRPMGVQLFGSCPKRMAEAAAQVEARLRPDFIDINCGCPADKITDQHAGSSLLKDPDRLASIVRACVTALDAGSGTPLTVKIRIGWDSQNINALEVGKRIQDAGARALAIHGRTREQGYSGEADWATINKVAETLHIPVIGNGNLDSAQRVRETLASSPVRGLMIGRAALGYPWLFNEIKHFLRTGTLPSPPSLEARWQTILRYADLLLAHRDDKDPEGSVGWMRAKLKALTKDMPGIKHLRRELDQFTSLHELPLLAERHVAFYRERDSAKHATTNG